jgi:microsomal dipeptidase-like Zn-dependent dipeptidase
MTAVCSLALAVLSTDARAQLAVKLQQPPQNQLKVSDLWRITLTNPSTSSVDVYLYGTVTEEKDGEIVEATSGRFTAKPGVTIVTAAQIGAIKVGRSHPRYQAVLTQTGSVPTGDYTACISVRAASNDEELGSDCVEAQVELVAPPILIAPADGDEVTEGSPAFSWQAPIGAKGSIVYAVKVVEMLGRQSGLDAIEKNPAHVEASVPGRTILPYPASGRRLVAGARYAWRVTAYSGKAVLGESEVYEFTYRGSTLPAAGDVVRDRPVPRVDPCTFGNWGFESGTLCHWHPEGDAFASGQPARGNAVLGANGTWYVSTSDAATGALRSDTFEIETGYVRLLVGGGEESRRVGVELHVIQPEDVDYTGAIVLRVHGRDAERMLPAEFDVRRYPHMRAYLRIVDEGTGPMGHINVDYVEFTDEPLVKPIVAADCDLENWSFETSTLHCWTPSELAPGEVQNAFLWQPIRYTGPRRSGAPTGSYWINTELVQVPVGRSGVASPQWRGSLTSKLVTLNRRWITFQIGGGFPGGARDGGSLRVELLVADASSPTGFSAQRTASVTGDNRRALDLLRRVAWAVGDLAGRQAVIRIVDSSASGFVACDDFVFTDAEPANWDFEAGLDYWTPTGSAFREQPTYGETMPATRARPPGFDAGETERLGGDYWNSLVDIGHHLDYWVGTGERRPTPESGPSLTPFDSATGVLISREVALTARYITLLVSGPASNGTKVELYVDSATAMRRLGGKRRPATGGRPQTLPAGFEVCATATGAGSEMMRRVTWDVGDLAGGRAYIVVTDNARDAHINVDDILFANEQRTREYYAGTRFGAIVRDSTRDDVPDLWGFGDFHTHPMTHLGFGGLLHGEPTGPIARALRACDGLVHGASLRMPVPRSIQDLRTVARLLIPFAIFDELGLPGEREGFINVPQLVLQSMEHNHSTTEGHRPQGMPQFNGQIRFTGEWDRIVERGWPSYTTVSHQQMHRDWIRRAWQGGFRIMCALGLNNELLSVAAGRRQRDADVLTPQMDFMKQMARENGDWMEIAYSAADARRIIADGKLCVVLGVEYDRLADFFPETGTVAEKVDAALDRLTREGVRHIFPIHLADNVFGGYDLNKDLLNLNTYFLNGRFSDVRDGAPHNVTYKSFGGLPGPGEHLRVHLLGQGFAGVELYGNPTYRPGSPVEPRGGGITLLDLDFPGIYAAMGGVANDEAFRAFTQTNFRIDALALIGDLQRTMDSYARFATHVNALGLTDAGRTMLGAMMRRGLLIDIDHMSALATDTALGILERNDYPVVSGHNDYRSLHTRHRHEGQHTDEQLRRIASLGSVAGSVGNIGDDVIGAELCQGTSWSWLKGYEYVVGHMPGAGIGIGTDMNGFLGGPGPRFGPQACTSRTSENAGDITMHRGVLYRHYSRSRIDYPEENFAVSVPLPTASTLRTTHVSAYRWQPPMTACTTGTRTFDFNTDGLAHIGLVPDMIQDCRNLGMTPSALRIFMGSAEAFVEMWEKAERRGEQMRAGTGPRR